VLVFGQCKYVSAVRDRLLYFYRETSPRGEKKGLKYEVLRCLWLEGKPVDLVDTKCCESVEITNKMQPCNKIYYSNVY